MRVFHKSLNVAVKKKRRPAAIAGDRPPRYGKKRPLTVGLGPSHTTRACERVSLAMPRSRERFFVIREFDNSLSLAMQRSRGTGPRATKKTGPFLSLARQRSRGTGPRATVKKNAALYVGRGPVPRHATIAGDRPPRYEKKRHPFNVFKFLR